MNSINKIGENIMLKIKKKDFIQERKNNFYLDEEIKKIKIGGVNDSIAEKLWRGKTESFKSKSNQEKNFYLKEVMKKYQTNQDELKGYNYKYVLELSDLLGQRDKDFSKKRLELYNHRIEKEKKQYSKTHEKFIKYQTFYKPKKQTNYFMDFFDSRKKNNYAKGNSMHSFNNTMYNNKQNNNIKKDAYYRTTYNYNWPNKYNFLLDNKNKKCNDRKYNNILTEFNNKRNEKEEQSFDTTSLVGKEDFLASGDKERYHEYLSREYNFFNQARLRQMKYIFDKQKRIKLFKKLPNAKFLNYKKDNPLRTELFNKINREKQKLVQDFSNSLDTKLYLKNKKIHFSNRPKTKFNQDYQNIFIKLKKELCIE